MSELLKKKLTTISWPILFLTLILAIIFTVHFKCRSLIFTLEHQYPIYKKEIKSYQLVSQRPKTWLRLNQISHFAKWAIIISEDWAFYNHDGIDEHQMKIVIEDGLKKGKFKRGASTITQQVVKNVFLSNERSFQRKIYELVLASYLDYYLSKDKILEIYLNLAEFGPNIYGIQNGAKFYFHKSAHTLNPKEAAFLAMLLPSPKKYAQSFFKKELTVFVNNRIENILGKMQKAKIITPEEKQFYLETPLSFEKAVP